MDDCETKSADYEIKPSSLGGKGLFAKRDFNRHDLIFQENWIFFQQKSTLPSHNCSHCLRFLGPIEKQLELICSDLGLRLPHHNALKSVHDCAPPLPTGVQCSRCSVWYCGTNCRDLAWSQYHCLLCAQDNDPHYINIQKYLALTKKGHSARLEIIGKILSAIILRKKNSKETLDECIDFFVGEFVTVSFTEAFVWSSGIIRAWL